MSKTTPTEYVRQVKSEMKKVTWPSRGETIASMISVFIMVFICSLFLYFADQVITFVVGTILGL